MMDEANVQQAVPLFAVTNIETSVRYYVDGLGFAMTRVWFDDGKLRWCWLNQGGAALMLQEFPREGVDARVPPVNPGDGVTIYFVCSDAIAMYRAITSRGIQASRPVVENGMWITSLVDPDGYSIAFESYTDAPEDAVFAAEEE